MSYKVTRRNEATFYEAPGHFDVRTTRLHNPNEVNDGVIIYGLSHFLPGGGTNVAPANYEQIYYVTHGELTIELYDENDNVEKILMKAGDSVHFGKGTKRSLMNNCHETTQMLVTMVK